eukprot:7382858-Ditylum_brightwellii.AAC.1
MVLAIVLTMVMTVPTSNSHIQKRLNDCCLTERSMQNKLVDDDNGDSVDNSDDGANKHLAHLSQA